MATRPDQLPYEARLDDFMKIVRGAQRDIAQQIAAAIASGDLQRAAQRRLQLSAVLATLDQLGAEIDPLARRLVAQAHEQSAAAVATQIRGLQIDAPEIPGAFAGVSTDTVRVLQDSIVQRLGDARVTVGRTVDDLYARAGRRAALRAVLGADDSPQAAARRLAIDLSKDRVVRRMLDEGGFGFVDKAGKRWALDTYSEMAVRTVTREAVVQGALARMASHGIDLARVSRHASSCALCQPWEGRLVSLDGQTSSYEGEAVADLSALPHGGPPFHPNCFVAETRVEGAYSGATARPYEGEVVRVHVASGAQITCTPNHPVLTGRGWVAAGSLDESDDLIRCVDMKAAMARVGVDPHDHREPAEIGEVAEALPVILGEMPVAPEDFHGDGAGSEIHVVHVDGELWDTFDAALLQHRLECELVRALVGPWSMLDGPGAGAQLGAGVHLAADGGVRTFDTGGPGAHRDAAPVQAIGHGARRASELLGDLLGAQSLGVEPDAILGRGYVFADGMANTAAARADSDAGVNQGVPEPAGLDSESACDLRVRLAGVVERDRVVDVDRSWFRGHVYNLITPCGWYAAEGLVVHNCRHTVQAVAVSVEAFRRQQAGATA